KRRTNVYRRYRNPGAPSAHSFSEPAGDARTPPLPAHRTNPARAVRAAADTDHVRARDRAGAEDGVAHRRELRVLRRDRHRRPADPAEHDVLRARRDRRPRQRRPARAVDGADSALPGFLTWVA